MTTHEMFTICPHCGRKNELQSVAFTDEGTDLPEDGDVSMCFGCFSLSIFDKGAHGGLRPPTSDEEKEMTQSPQIQTMLGAVRKMCHGPNH